MTAPNPARQKVALKTLDDLFANATNVTVIHYSCESFYDRPEGRSPRITSIALRKLDSAQTTSFSIHQVAERRGTAFNQIDNHYNTLEKEMLTTFFEHLGSYRQAKYLHWNMRDVNYGFQAIQHRFEVLGEEPYEVPEDKKVDLARLLIDIYGVAYIGHPRMINLMERNHIAPRDFLTGADEALAFDQRNFAALHQSTLRKVDIIANIAGRAHDRYLRTNTSWWAMHGGRIRTFVTWTIEHKALAFTGTAITIASALIFLLTD